MDIFLLNKSDKNGWVAIIMGYRLYTKITFFVVYVLLGEANMLLRLRIICVFLLFLSACSTGQTIQQKNMNKIQLKHVVSKELKKTNLQFILIQKTNNKENTFLGTQIGNNWILKHKTKAIQLEKKGQKVIMIVNKKQETLSIEQFGIISPLDHLKLVGTSGNIIRNISSNQINNKLNHITVVIDEKKLAHILLERLNISNTKDVSPYLSGKVKVTYDLYYTPRTNTLIRFSTNIISLGNHKDRCTLSYLLNPKSS